MEKNCLIFDNIKGGLEKDIVKLNSSKVRFHNVKFKPKRFNIAIYLLKNINCINKYDIISCGGFWQLFFLVIITSFKGEIYSPGISKKYYSYFNLTKFRDFKIYTCDISFSKKFNLNFYQNFTRINIPPKQIKTRDIIIVGRNDKNKRFNILCSKLSLMNFNIAHAGHSGESLKKFGVDSLGILNKKKLDLEYRKSKFLVLFSIYESSPLVVHEALSNGCAVICKKVGNLKYLEFTGLFNSDEELINSLSSLVYKSDNELNKLIKCQIKSFNNYINEFTTNNHVI